MSALKLSAMRNHFLYLFRANGDFVARAVCKRKANGKFCVKSCRNLLINQNKIQPEFAVVISDYGFYGHSVNSFVSFNAKRIRAARAFISQDNSGLLQERNMLILRKFLARLNLAAIVTDTTEGFNKPVTTVTFAYGFWDLKMTHEKQAKILETVRGRAMRINSAIATGKQENEESS